MSVGAGFIEEFETDPEARGGKLVWTWRRTFDLGEISMATPSFLDTTIIRLSGDTQIYHILAKYDYIVSRWKAARCAA